jgi:hypothetical protein
VQVGEAARMVEANPKRLVVVQRVPEQTQHNTFVQMWTLSTNQMVPVN